MELRNLEVNIRGSIDSDVSICCRECGRDIKDCDWNEKFQEIRVPFCEYCTQEILNEVKNIQDLIDEENLDTNLISLYLGKIENILS